MSKSMFERLGNQQPMQRQQLQMQQAQQPNIPKLFAEFQKNPLKFLPNAPQGVTDLRELLKFYADNGKVPPQLQGRVNAALGRR